MVVDWVENQAVFSAMSAVATIPGIAVYCRNCHVFFIFSTSLVVIVDV